MFRPPQRVYHTKMSSTSTQVRPPQMMHHKMSPVRNHARPPERIRHKLSCVSTPIRPLQMVHRKTSSASTHVRSLQNRDKGRSSVVKASDFKSEDPGFDPLAEQGDEQLVYLTHLTLVLTCLCLTSLRVYHTHPNLFARLRSHFHLS